MSNIKKDDLNSQYPIKNDSFKPKTTKDVVKSIKKFNRKHDILEYLLLIFFPLFIFFILIAIICSLMELIK